MNKVKRISIGLALTQREVLIENKELLDTMYNKLCDTKNDVEGIVFGYTIIASFLANYNNKKEVKEILNNLSKIDWDKAMSKKEDK